MPGGRAISNTCNGEKEKCEAGVYHAKTFEAKLRPAMSVIEV